MTIASLSPPKAAPIPNAVLRRLSVLGPLTQLELERLGRLLAKKQVFEPPTEVLTQGEGARRAAVVEEGWCYRFKLLSDGRRQLLGLVLPGDFVGLRCGLFGIDDHSAVALTPMRAGIVPIGELVELFAEYPKIAASFSAVSAREEAMLAQHVVRLGRMNAYERTAHLFLEIHRRLALVGLGDPGGFPLPLTQELLADLLGITVVHVNRTLRRLRQDGLVTVEHGRVTLHDMETLIEISEFDPQYLEPEIPVGTRLKLMSMEPERRKREA